MVHRSSTGSRPPTLEQRRRGISKSLKAVPMSTITAMQSSVEAKYRGSPSRQLPERVGSSCIQGHFAQAELREWRKQELVWTCTKLSGLRRPASGYSMCFLAWEYYCCSPPHGSPSPGYSRTSGKLEGAHLDTRAAITLFFMSSSPYSTLTRAYLRCLKFTDPDLTERQLQQVSATLWIDEGMRQSSCPLVRSALLPYFGHTALFALSITPHWSAVRRGLKSLNSALN